MLNIFNVFDHLIDHNQRHLPKKCIPLSTNRLNSAKCMELLSFSCL